MANSFKHRWKRSVTDENNAVLNAPDREFTADGAIKLDPTIPASSTNFLITFAFTRAEVLSYWISAPGALTLKTNSSGSPQDTIALAANIPITWNADQNISEMHFSGNVTALYVTNADTNAVELKIRVLHDITPST